MIIHVIIHQVRALERFYNTLSIDQDRAAYGFREVFYANQNLAIDELLVTDKLFKSAAVEERKKYVNLVESVKENGGKVDKILPLSNCTKFISLSLILLYYFFIGIHI
jgi:stalled ribosome rescue protein Dom34